MGYIHEFNIGGWPPRPFPLVSQPVPAPGRACSMQPFAGSALVHGAAHAHRAEHSPNSSCSPRLFAPPRPPSPAVHGDLKPGNVLLKTHKVDRRGYIAKVSDFGLSRPLDMEDTHARCVCGGGGGGLTGAWTAGLGRGGSLHAEPRAAPCSGAQVWLAGWLWHGLNRSLLRPLAPCSLDGTLGTIAYSAPETFAHNQVKKPSDVYAFGIMREWGST